jgi:hypothetical protein
MSEPKLSKAYYCGDPKRGAAMGRPSHGMPKGKVRLYQLSLDSGGYDNGGAYWGFAGNGNLKYRAFGEGFEYFLCAKNRDEAIDVLRDEFPDIKFIRGKEIRIWKTLEQIRATRI